jgi:energy-coupling factor transport system substrate-specific component
MNSIAKNKNRGLKLADILVTVFIAVVFGIIYRVWSSVYDLAKLAGLQMEQLTYGMWFMAATVAFLIIRKPGVALLAEVAAGFAEMVMASSYGLESLTYGIVQGLLAEIVFAAFLYRNFSLGVTCLAGLGAGIGCIAMDWFKGYMFELNAWNLTLYVVFKLISAIVITGVFAYYLVKALEKTGVTQLVRPAAKEDYEALNR